MENKIFLTKPKSATIQSGAAASSSSIDDVVSTLETTAPIIPQTVVQHFLNTAGLSTTDPQITQLISLASEKFIADIVSDAMKQTKAKNPEKSSKGNTLLTMNELSLALKERGVDAKKPYYKH